MLRSSHSRAVALLASSAALILGTLAAAITTPVSQHQHERQGAALAILLGAHLLPAACMVGAARELQS